MPMADHGMLVSWFFLSKTKRTNNEIVVIDNPSSDLVAFFVFVLREIRIRTHHVLDFNDPILISQESSCVSLKRSL